MSRFASVAQPSGFVHIARDRDGVERHRLTDDYRWRRQIGSQTALWRYHGLIVTRERLPVGSR